MKPYPVATELLAPVLWAAMPRAVGSAPFLTHFLPGRGRTENHPREVTGIEDFDWEEYYVWGPGSPKEYERLKKHQPSYRDRFELMAIERDVVSEWMLFGGEDIAAHVRRKSDGKEFYLGLAELKTVDRRSPSYQLLDDYAVFFTNYR